MMKILPKYIKGIAIALLLAALLAVSAVVMRIGPERLENLIKTSILDSELISLTNINRTEAGLAELQVNPLLQKAAQAAADDMAAKGYFAHTNPEGRRFTEWIKDAGYDYLYAGENLAVRFDDSKAVDVAWMNSPTHRENILSSDFSEIGIGLAKGSYKGQETTFVVQMFGRAKLPLALKTESEEVVAEGQWRDLAGEEKSMVVATKNGLDLKSLGEDLVRPLLLNFLPLR